MPPYPPAPSEAKVEEPKRLPNPEQILRYLTAEGEPSIGIGWLIEKGQKALGLLPDNRPGWLEYTHPGVIRFARERDAVGMLWSLRSFGDEGFLGCYVSEHAWGDTTQLERKVVEQSAVQRSPDALAWTFLYRYAKSHGVTWDEEGDGGSNYLLRRIIQHAKDNVQPAPSEAKVEEPKGEWDVKRDAAWAMIRALCSTKFEEGHRDWVMSIPVNMERDPDVVIGTALRVAEETIASLRRQLEEKERGR